MPRSYDFVAPTGTASSLKFARDHYDPMYWNEDASSLGYYFDKPFASKRAWVVDPWSDDLRRAPISAEARRSWVQWKKHTPVLTRGDEAATDRWLDSMSYGDLVVRELGLSKDVFRLSDPLVATGDYGVSSDVVSAYGAKLLGLAGHRRLHHRRRRVFLSRRQCRDLAAHRQSNVAGRDHGHAIICRRAVRADRFHRARPAAAHAHSTRRHGRGRPARRQAGDVRAASMSPTPSAINSRASAARPRSSPQAAGLPATSCAICRRPTWRRMHSFITDRYWSPMWPCAIGRPSRSSVFRPRTGSMASVSSSTFVSR